MGTIAVVPLWTSGAGHGQTTLPLNTGYNHAAFALYPVGAQDNYWIKIASYEPPAPGAAVAPAWVVALPTSTWAGPLPNSNWIGPMSTPYGPSGAAFAQPAYSIYRKCFCLIHGFQNPQLSVQIRGDDNIQVWLNNITNTLAGPASGNPLGSPRSGSTTDPAKFRTGRNCVYVLLEAYFGPTGFNLSGTVSAFGLMPMAAAGPGGSFGPCQCPNAPPSANSTPAAAGDLPGAAALNREDDSAVIQAIVGIAEARRASALAVRMGSPQPWYPSQRAGAGGMANSR